MKVLFFPFIKQKKKNFGYLCYKKKKRKKSHIPREEKLSYAMHLYIAPSQHFGSHESMRPTKYERKVT